MTSTCTRTCFMTPTRMLSPPTTSILASTRRNAIWRAARAVWRASLLLPTPGPTPTPKPTLSSSPRTIPPVSHPRSFAPRRGRRLRSLPVCPVLALLVRGRRIRSFPVRPTLALVARERARARDGQGGQMTAEMAFQGSSSCPTGVPSVVEADSVTSKQDTLRRVIASKTTITNVISPVKVSPRAGPTLDSPSLLVPAMVRSSSVWTTTTSLDGGSRSCRRLILAASLRMLFTGVLVIGPTCRIVVSEAVSSAI
mmetsp:Transcript_18175/g.39354  ORF Transcript_18175/g.39354 Transcript_18175/m.39354 type:complete len:254 (+) Transcript_18175:533-1294(+)